MADDPQREVWLRTNEIEEFIDALEHAARLAGQIHSDVKVWKWLILAPHSALQDACVCALRGRDTAGVIMFTEKSWRAVWHWLGVDSRKDPCPPRQAERLASLKDLFARVRDPSLLPAPHTLIVGPGAVADIVKLSRLRNDLIHFVPLGLSVELSGIPRITGHAADAIEHLAVDQPTFWHHLRRHHRDRIAAALSDLRKQVSAWAAPIEGAGGAS